MTKNQQPFLVVFSGLPGTGKTTISTMLAAALHAVYLRIDTIEQAMRAAGAKQIGPSGYAVANGLARANLLLGHSIVADCVNPVRESRLGWGKVAAEASAELINIHLICSDAAEHRRRVDERSADIPGHRLPNWSSVMRHMFEPRDDDHLLLDTATMTLADLVECCTTYVTSKLDRS
ncbi:MAG TPA: AAA family ATPase [Acidiphilium sp.]|nr:MAG: kinase [Acidiphilium sp. 21-60-14]OYV90393.1 MAG: kinase [Acidiphilium sp. 37-60-79]OZB40474.1 MAG: kinase [Acidiphilium sp. 34-60-192]HQT88939.1 AAA family ATPase [Acidiphilium sp.]HQU24467.1 AAA family ATPase [Acidiphilium sp.]